MKRQNNKLSQFSSLTAALLVLLWVYAALSKLLDYEQSRSEMLNQVFPAARAEVLTWAVPAVEIVTAGLLVSTRTRIMGIAASLTLLVSFTVYIALIKLNYFGYVPCSCGGVISKLSWEQHFLFNMVFIVLAGIALILEGHAKILSANNREMPKTRTRVGKTLNL